MISVDIKKTTIELPIGKIYYNNTFLDFVDESDSVKGLIKFSIDNHSFEYQIPNYGNTISATGGIKPMFGCINDKNFYAIYRIENKSTGCL